ncbi:hypothetical protein QFZ79_000384 [Arthrobacter sp. V4I6]|uniref:LytR C-terminal domain-containing protein n=1 Tax=unclassified Arthrobacter TaxID=235627 RepID=UPI00277F87D9|nr:MULTISPECIES: LytR C-terminal domain-containing protein [unclassified Arthrobacter]MDQ0822645.1 hypothetical protein [Arthrobacter sp. V1I7]MDQ0852273.1 hypothetical protein [Arthrobacter sp. V4I6]
MTKYARDEFDQVPETPTRQGVHRAAAESRRRSLAPVLAVGAAALVIGLVAFLFLPKLGFNSAGNSSAVTAEQSASPTASPAPSAGSPAAASESPSATATPSDAPSPTATPEDAAVVDKTQPVAIYNATGTPGLAGRVGDTVASDGWILGPRGNWGGARQTSSVIFYNGAQQRSNAEALASLLGIQSLVDSAQFNMPLVVVLGPGFQ